MSTVGTSDWMCVDRRGSAHQIFTLLVDMSRGSGTATVEFTVQDTTEDNILAIGHDILADVETSCCSRQTSPVTAFRLNVTTHTDGDIVLRILQAGYFGN